MRRVLSILTAPVAAALAVTFLASSAQADVKKRVYSGRDSFLTLQADTIEELAAVVRQNATLRKRYSRHFNIPENQVADWMERSLIPYRMPEDKRMTVYGVTRAGMIYPVKTTIKKGELVWATRSGDFILRWRCSNPLLAKLPTKPGITRVVVTPRPVVRTAEPNLKSFTDEIIIPTDSLVTALEPTVEVMPDDSFPIIAGGGEAFSPGGGRGGLRAGIIPLLLAGTVIATNGSGGRDEVRVSFSVKPIPEPGTLPLLALAAPALAGLCLARRRKK